MREDDLESLALIMEVLAEEFSRTTDPVTKQEIAEITLELSMVKQRLESQWDRGRRGFVRSVVAYTADKS